MAALEKIRSKAVLLTVVIGLALLAFIMGDALTSGKTYFGDGNTIAVVGGEKIDAIEFQNRCNEVSARTQGSDQQQDAAVLQKQVFNQMVSELVLRNEVEAAGIYVTDQELTEALTGANARQEAVQFARQMGAESPAALYDMLFNPGKYGIAESEVLQFRDMWLELEEQMELSLRYEKLQTLITGALQANELDRKAVWAENATTAAVACVKVPYSTLKNDDYQVSDKEIKAQYEKDKAQYKLKAETRHAYIITVDVVPSDDDLAQAQALIDTTYALVKSTEGIDEIRNSSDLVINEARVRETDIRDKDVKEFITGAKVGDVMEPTFSSNVHRIVKLTGKNVEIDSVKVNVVMAQGDKALQDSVKALLDGGASVADVQSIAGVQGQEDLWQVLLQVPDSIKNKLLGAEGQYVSLTESTQGAYFWKVTEKADPKTIYDVADITYTVYPSTTTVNTLNDNLQNFINENNTTELFAANATKSDYNAMPVTVTAEDAQINNIEGSRECVKWLFEVNKGSVSPIMKKGDVILSLALSEVYDNGYTTLENEQVLSTETTRARNAKKADALIEQYAGKASDLEGYAAAMNAKIDTVKVTFGQRSIPKIGMNESNLLARMPVAAQDEVQGPIAGNNAIYVYKHVADEETKRAYTPEEASRQFALSRGGTAVMNHWSDIVRNAIGYENKMMRFF